MLSRRVDYPIQNNFFSKFKYNHPAIKKIICVSNAIQEIIQQNIKYPKRCTVVHSGIDLNKFNNKKNIKNGLKKEFKIPSEKILIANTSAMTTQKDYPTFIHTASKLLKKHSNLHFLIIGEGPQLESLQSLVKSLKVEQNIIFTGFRRDIDVLLPQVDILLFTSQKEGLGTSILDALASGVPVVATRVGGIPEIIENKISGLLAEAGNIDQLAEHTLSLISSKVLRKKIIRGGKQKVKNFSKSKTASRTVDHYFSVL